MSSYVSSDDVNSESMNRFNNIIQSLPLRTRLSISSLCLLDNISTQMLRFLIFNSNSPHVLALFTDRSNYLNSGETETFQTLLKLFKQVRLIYNTRSPLLNVHDVAPGLWFPNSPPPLLLRGHEAFIITAIRKTNLLTFILTALNCFNYGFDFLQSTFLDIFCPNTLFTGTTTTDQNGKFLKSQAILYLDLKTQAFIGSLRQFEDDSKQIPINKLKELLNDIFPNNLADQLISRRTGSNFSATNDSMTPSEKDFVERCDRRKDNLIQFTDFKSLINSYDWNHFIKELLDYCNRNMGLIIWGRKGRGKSPLYSFDSAEFDPQILFASGASAAPMENNNNSNNNSSIANNDANTSTTSGHDVTFDENNNNNNNNNTNTHVDGTTQVGMTVGGDSENTDFLASVGNVSSDLVQASRNKQANRMTQYIVNAAVAASSSSGSIKKLKAKRTWSKEEENALTEGLKEVGPSWSKILDLYGPGGRISEDLKNRTQVQLKDKARNWKLQYLKSGKELPDYLMKVTGNIDKAYKSKKRMAQEAAATAVAATTSQHQNDDAGSSMVDDSSRQASQSQDPNGDLFERAANEASGFDPNLESTM